MLHLYILYTPNPSLDANPLFLGPEGDSVYPKLLNAAAVSFTLLTRIFQEGLGMLGLRV